MGCAFSGKGEYVQEDEQEAGEVAKTGGSMVIEEDVEKEDCGDGT